MNISMEEIIKLGSLVLGTVNLLVSTGLWLYVRNSDRHDKIDARFSELEANVDARLDGTVERLARLEERVERSPTHDDLGRIYDRINGVVDGVARVDASVGKVDGGLLELTATVRQLMSRIIDKGFGR